MQLNAVYIASSSINTAMIQNQKKGIAGTVGSFFSGMASSVPLIGVGAKFIGGLLNTGDEYVQSKKVTAYANIVFDSNEMALLSNKIALRVASELVLDEHMSSAFMERLNSFAQYLDTNKMIDVIREKMKSVHAKKPTQEEIQKQEEMSKVKKEAEVLTAMVIDALCDNKIPKLNEANNVADQEKRAAAKAELIIRFIVEEYKLKDKKTLEEQKKLKVTQNKQAIIPQSSSLSADNQVDLRNLQITVAANDNNNNPLSVLLPVNPSLTMMNNPGTATSLSTISDNKTDTDAKNERKKSSALIHDNKVFPADANQSWKDRLAQENNKKATTKCCAIL
jgi:hypothetical protein